MAPVANCARFTIGGTADNGEIWDTSFWARWGGSGMDAATFQGIVDDLATAFTGATGFANAIKNMLGTGGAITTFSGLFYEGGAHAAFAGSHQYNPAVAGTSPNLLPLQTSMVISLRTPLPSKRTRGRMYLPANACDMQAGHRFADTQVQSAVNSAVNWFAVIRTSGDGWFTGIMSDGAKLATPAPSIFTEITYVTADTKPDIQRRRANAMSGGTIHRVNIP